MVTRIHKHARGHLYLREHRKAKGLTAEIMAGRLGIERESVLRQERKPHGVNAEWQAKWAEALDISPRALWSPPSTPSVDDILEGQPPEIAEMALDIVRRLVAGRK